MKNEIVKFVISELESKNPIPCESLNDKLSFQFLDGGHIDSFDTIMLITNIEDRFNIQFNPEHLQSEEFRVVSGIVNIVESLIIQR